MKKKVKPLQYFLDNSLKVSFTPSKDGKFDLSNMIEIEMNNGQCLCQHHIEKIGKEINVGQTSSQYKFRLYNEPEYGFVNIWCAEWLEDCEIDWNNVPIDTKILVKDTEMQSWDKKHFAGFKDGKVFTWANGRTSFTEDNEIISSWKYAKLAEEVK